MSAQVYTSTAEQKENDGMLAIQAIEATVADLTRHNGVNAHRAAELMSRYAQGRYNAYLPTAQTTAIRQKIVALIQRLQAETSLTRSEIKDLIRMVCYA